MEKVVSIKTINYSFFDAEAVARACFDQSVAFFFLVKIFIKINQDRTNRYNENKLTRLKYGPIKHMNVFTILLINI